MRPIAFACVLACAAPVLAGEDPVPTVKEEETGVRFPTWLKAPRGEGTGRVDLLGTGVRQKTIFNVNVYALGLYADLDRAVPALRAAAGTMDRKAAVADTGFRNVLLRDEIGKSLRWVMCRDVDGEDIASAFAKSLDPRIAALAKTDEEKQAAKAAVTTFRALFTTELTKGTELLFHWEPGGRLHTVIGGESKSSIRSAILCAALFAVYLDDDPISEDAKTHILEGAWKKVEEAKAKAEEPAPPK